MVSHHENRLSCLYVFSFEMNFKGKLKCSKSDYEQLDWEFFVKKNTFKRSMLSFCNHFLHRYGTLRLYGAHRISTGVP